MVTRKPVPMRQAAPSSISGSATSVPSPPPVPGTPIVTAPTPTSGSNSPPIPWQALPPQASPSPPQLAEDVTPTSVYSQDATPMTRPYPASDSEEDEWDRSDSSSEEEWDLADDDDNEPKITPPAEVPAPLRISRPSSQELDKAKGKGKAEEGDLPLPLRVGPPGGVPIISSESLPHTENAMDSNNPWRSVSQSPPRSGNVSSNPFLLRPQNTGEALFGSQNSSAVWSNASSPQPAGAVAELPSMTSPVDDRRRRLEISELSSASSPIGQQSPLWPAASIMSEGQQSMSTSDPFGPIPAEGLVNAQQSWLDHAAIAPGSKINDKVRAPIQAQLTGGSLVDIEGSSAVPALPPRTSTELEDRAPPKPPRTEQPNAGAAAAAEATRATMGSPATAMKRQRNQTYQIKKVRWFDDRKGDTRVSPILIQNANGPCPLLALVNALTLSTSVDQDSGLVETLRTREQVSLGLLLDAVFEELMSGRRGDGVQALPDVGELYSFLIALHTGMNVNPQFTRNHDTAQLRQPGAFERTKEMMFYSTFSIPLIHGWIPEPNSEAYAAFERSAKTYEDAQNVQFYEEELEAKLSSTGLKNEEQHMFEDLVSIKQFLSTWPTQLTDYGLTVIREHLRPGQFAILFRNDHFSTIYKEPRSDSLVTVVTDAGYASHDEIVWESLVDINGMATEHFSGDFRPVSHNAPTQSISGAPQVGKRNSSLGGQNVQSMLDVDHGWTQTSGKKGKRGKNAHSSGQQSGITGGSSSSGAASHGHDRTGSSSAGGVSQAEQEDADLALALQLQEEEDERQRRDLSERRSRQLSSQVLDQSTLPTSIRPLIPPRRQGPAFTTNRPTSASEEAPPPSYEDASKDRRFNPPRDHPASPHAPINSIGDSIGQPTSNAQTAPRPLRAASAGDMWGTSASVSSNIPLHGGRRDSRPLPGLALGRGTSRPSGRLGGPMSPVGAGANREEKCVVM